MTILLYDLVGADPAHPFSPHCWKVKMALKHKGLDFRPVPTRFLEVSTLENGGAKTVPVIRDGERVVADSFSIALDRPTLFGGEGGQSMARFIERWSQLTIHPFLGQAAAMDIFARQDEANARYFRASREKRFGRPLEEVAAGRDAARPAFRASLEPLRSTLGVQPWIGGQVPLFSDYIVFSALQWVRVASPYAFLATDDPIAAWFERCLDLHGRYAREVPAAA